MAKNYKKTRYSYIRGMVCWSKTSKNKDLILPINSLEKDVDKKVYGEKL